MLAKACFMDAPVLEKVGSCVEGAASNAVRLEEVEADLVKVSAELS